MNLKPVILGIQFATLLLIFSFMQRFGITIYNTIGALVMTGSILLNGYMFYLDQRKKRWEKSHFQGNAKKKEEKVIMEQKKWIVNNNSGHGCEDITIWDSMEEANASALEQWNALHPVEKQLTVITVHYVTESMLEDYAADKGEINWYLYKTCAETPECFDSKEYKKTHE